MSWVSIGPSSARRGQASTFPAISGRVSGIALPRRGQRLYIATANGGVWRSDDGGVTWRPLMDRFDRDPRVSVNPTSINNAAAGVDTLACGAIAIHPDHQDTLFVGTGEAAASWQVAPFYFGAGIAVSTDAGLTWTIEEETTAQDGQPSTDMLGIGFYALVVDPSNKDIAVAATTRGVYVRQRVGAEYRWS
ncbi:MAG: WD40/YVTN/BNR-like repeat-containing protein, partial [Desulfobulbus sp.]